MVWSNDWQLFTDRKYNHSYKFFFDKLSNAVQAEAACRVYGAKLVSINTADEMDFVALKVVRRRVLSAYIGGQLDVTGIIIQNCQQLTKLAICTCA